MLLNQKILIFIYFFPLNNQINNFNTDFFLLKIYQIFTNIKKIQNKSKNKSKNIYYLTYTILL